MGEPNMKELLDIFWFYVDNKFSNAIEVANLMQDPRTNSVWDVIAFITAASRSLFGTTLELAIIDEFLDRNQPENSPFTFELEFKYIMIHYNGEGNVIIHEIIPYESLFFVTTHNGSKPQTETFINGRKLKCQVEILGMGNDLRKLKAEFKGFKRKCIKSISKLVEGDLEDDDYLLVRYGKKRVVYTIVRYANTVQVLPDLRKGTFVHVTVGQKTCQAMIIRQSKDYLDLEMALYHINKITYKYYDTKKLKKFTPTRHMKYLRERREQLRVKTGRIGNDILVIQKELEPEGCKKNKNKRN